MAWQAVLCATGLALAAPAMALADRAHFEIPAQAMPGALKAFAAQAHMQLLYQYKAVESVKANSVSGDLDKRAALEQLLRNSGLEAVYTSESAATIQLIGGHAEPTTRNDAAKEGKTSSSEGFLVAQATSGQASTDASLKRQGDTSAQNQPIVLEEVIVTAQKREERLQDVPLPVTALNASALLENNQVRLQDYYTQVPGLNVTTDDFGAPMLTIRGITSATYANPSVGVVVDDVPFGSSSSLGGGQEAPDFDPNDLARVEILRGPQGTLYGASSIGGLIKYVTIDPSTAGLTGHVQAGGSAVTNAEHLGYTLRAAVNVPITDTAAMRASAFTREDPGYIDNPTLGLNGINKGTFYGGRVAALWQPSDVFSIRFSALAQDSRIDGSPYVQVGPGFGDLQQNNVPGTGYYRQTLQAYSMTLNAKLGSIDLTSITGYNINSYSNSFDFTSAFGSLTEMFFGVTGTPVLNKSDTSKFTQELRISSAAGSRVQWRLGLFYDHEYSYGQGDILAAEPTTGEVVGQWVHDYGPATFEEYAVFGDATIKVSDRFDLELGGRESQNKQSFTNTYVGDVYTQFFFGAPSPVVYPEQRSKDSSFTYLLAPRFRFSPDFMMYARLASGYRPGGPNVSFGGVAPPSFKPDSTQSYEIGLKTDGLGHALTLDASVYYISWKDIQLGFIDPNTGIGYEGNGGHAKSQGVELAVTWRPLTGLLIDAWASWNDAELTEDLPQGSAIAASAGDRLPFTSKFSGNLSVQQDFAIVSGVTGFVGGTVSYVGEREGVFPAVPPRQTFAGYARTDLRAGVRFGSWTANFFANNVADRRGILNGGLGTFNPVMFQYIQPRTIGLSVSKLFGGP